MKIRRSVFWFVVICAVLMVLVIWLGKKPSEAPLPTVAATNTVPQPALERAGSEPGQRRAETPARSKTPVARVAADAPLPTPPLQTKEQQIREGLTQMNDVPIVFYGKLEDQFGNAVVGAQIAGNTIIYNGVKSGAEHVSTTSDANGFFQINAGKGESLGIMPHKEGYALATNRTEFKYSYMYNEHFTPDPNSPVVIKMWKLQGAEPLVGISKEYRLPFTGTPLFFDLLSGKASDSGGDLQVIVTRVAGSLSKRNPGDWSIELRPVNGGILESDDATCRVTYQAPAEGYQDGYLVQMNHDDRAWYDNVDKVLFLKSRGGQVYSKLSFEFRINNEPNGLMWFQFKGVANANGSRNWEATADTTEPR